MRSRPPMASAKFYQKGIKVPDLLQSKYQDRQKDKGKMTVPNELLLPTQKIEQKSKYKCCLVNKH